MCELLVRLSLFLILLLTNWKSFKICLWFCYFHPLSPDHPWGLHCVFSNVFCITTTIPKKLWRCVKSKFKKQNAIIWKWTVLTTVVISLIQSDWQTTSCLCLWVTDPFEDACFLNNEPVYPWNVADRCFGGVLQLSQPFVAPVLTCCKVLMLR